MANNVDNNPTFKCPECGLHYQDQATATKCQQWCAKYKSCNLDITKLSLEAKKNQ